MVYLDSMRHRGGSRISEICSAYRKYVIVWNIEDSQPVAYIYELKLRADKSVSAIVTRRTIRNVTTDASNVEYLQ